MRLALLLVGSLSLTTIAIACSSSTSTSNDPGATDGGGADVITTPSQDASPTKAEPYTDGPLKGCMRDPGAAPIAEVTSGTDPVGVASFTLDKAMAGYPSVAGTLTTLITTEQGSIKCTLAEKEAPATVANFVGLARGTRLAMTTTPKKWTAKKFYDGLIWHRVIPDFVIQGGDPFGDGTGGPGYDLPEENHIDEPAGTLAMAASDAPSGSQFYIVVGTGPKANYNVFGKCETESAIKIAGVPRDGRDKPMADVHMQTVEIARCP